MEDKLRCQSCGMPLGEGFFGSSADSSDNLDYCKFCYQSGDFVKPHLLLEELIERSIKNMTEELFFEKEKAEN
jgi:hypothetical protein